MTRIIVGIMGPGDGASADDCDRAAQLARLVAAEGWILLTGGRSAGVMEAASAAAARAGGLTIGILPGTDWTQASSAVAVAILTGVGEARDNINVLSSRVIFVCGISAGTAAEVALACKAGRPVIFVSAARETIDFFRSLDARFETATSPHEAMAIARQLLAPAP